MLCVKYNNVTRLCVLLYVTGMLGQGELRDQSSKPAKKWFCLSRKMTGHYFCAHALLMYTTHCAITLFDAHCPAQLS